MMAGPGGYGQPMMHGMVPPQTLIQQPQTQKQTSQVPQPQLAPQQQPQQPQQQQPQVASDDVGVKVKRAFAHFDSSLKVSQQYSTVIHTRNAHVSGIPSRLCVCSTDGRCSIKVLDIIESCQHDGTRFDSF
jgi:hypothetical protein